MTIEDLYEFAKSIGAENATFELDNYDDNGAYCGETVRVNVAFRDEEDGKTIVHLEPKGR